MQKYKAWSGPCACNPHRLLVFVFSYLVYPVGMGSLEVTKRMSVMLFCWFIAWLNWLMWKGNLSRRPGTVVAMRAVRRWGRRGHGNGTENLARAAINFALKIGDRNRGLLTLAPHLFGEKSETSSEPIFVAHRRPCCCCPCADFFYCVG